jgi:hypothetical protein
MTDIWKSGNRLSAASRAINPQSLQETRMKDTKNVARRLALLEGVSLSTADLESIAAEIEDLERVLAELEEFSQAIPWIPLQVQPLAKKI